MANLLYSHRVWWHGSVYTYLLRLLGFGQSQVLLQLLPDSTSHLEVMQSHLHHSLQRLQDALVHGLLQYLI